MYTVYSAFNAGSSCPSFGAFFFFSFTLRSTYAVLGVMRVYRSKRVSFYFVRSIGVRPSVWSAYSLLAHIYTSFVCSALVLKADYSQTHAIGIAQLPIASEFEAIIIVSKKCSSFNHLFHPIGNIRISITQSLPI